MASQPRLDCWLVSPPKWREPPSLLRSPFLAPLWVVSALALNLGRPSVTSPHHGATRYAASRHTTTDYQLACPLTNKKPTNKAAGRITERLKYGTHRLLMCKSVKQNGPCRPPAGPPPEPRPTSEVEPQRPPLRPTGTPRRPGAEGLRQWGSIGLTSRCHFSMHVREVEASSLTPHCRLLCNCMPRLQPLAKGR